MKRILTLALILSLLACGAPALAWQVGGLPWDGGYPLDDNPQSIDLDGDGRAETIYAETLWDEYDDSFQRLHVTGADGADCAYDVEILSDEHGWVGDLDRDGVMEILLWGDVMSDDYCTWCLRYDGHRLAPVLFADINRGENGDGYFKAGYGRVTGIREDGAITLSGTQDVLGTYFMERALALTGDGLFECVDDGRWTREMARLGSLDDPELWASNSTAVLHAVAAVPVVDGAPLAPGDRLLITGTDKLTEATFITQSGREGTLNISENYERGWGWLVDGIPEDALFEFVPYAD